MKINCLEMQTARPENPQTTRLIAPPHNFTRILLTAAQVSCFLIIGTKEEINKFLEDHKEVTIFSHLNQIIPDRDEILIRLSPYTTKPIGPTALGTNFSLDCIKCLIPSSRWCLEFRLLSTNWLQNDEKGRKWERWANKSKEWCEINGTTLENVRGIIERK
ncbi:23510_t:CDS:2 [Dentiscutata erythropus]|uniref:23510_t:CDS:1 n=1 Tax=Dentiscutata erythropus TaxID=1348616 RepID=A0A9N9BMH7_9GLOM|nr:23510_t:CDS:2 [Dentiscutata erythropus]